MDRAYDPDQTLQDTKLRTLQFTDVEQREMDTGVSRSSLVHGTQTNPNSDTWYDTDAFLLDQAKEVLNKLNEGSIDDEIWGKIVIMEKCKRVAKAYLRKTTVIIDGSEDEFDGKTLGFNHFDNPTRDEYTKEMRSKIADGVILKMDYQGNVKGMARGATPVICQGWKEPRLHCISDRLIRLQGKLNHGAAEDEKAYKVFDMKKFKNYLERELHDDVPDARTLLLKTCLRIALVKDGGDMNRTPCWFAVVNLVALDMLKEKIPNIKEIINRETAPVVIPKLINPQVPLTSDGLDAQTLTQIIAAAMTQANKTFTTTNTAQPNVSISPEQLAQIASTISIAQSNTMRTSDLTTISKKDKKKPYHFSNSSLDSSGEDSSGRLSEISAVKTRAKRWDKGVEQETNILEKKAVRSNRPLLQDAIFTRSQSITSDYDSNKEHFDSGSWSSTQSKYKGGRSTSSSVVSDHETVLAKKEGLVGLKETSEISEASGASDDDDDDDNDDKPLTALTNSHSITPSPPFFVPSLPEKDYNNQFSPISTAISKPSLASSPTSPSPPPKPQKYTPTQTPFNRSLTSQVFCPKLVGTDTWRSTPCRQTSQIPLPPPPLPITPQPEDGLLASLPYNNAFNSNPAFYDRHARQDMTYSRNGFYARDGQEMEIYFGRTTAQQPEQQHKRSFPFVSELRQVLEQRTNGLRLARNHSQPAAVHPKLRQFVANPINNNNNNNNNVKTINGKPHPTNNCSNTYGGRNTPDSAYSQIVGSGQVPRGLRRTTTIQETQQPQRYQVYSNDQSTLCREPTQQAVRVNRTGSLPWGQWQNVRRTHM